MLHSESFDQALYKLTNCGGGKQSAKVHDEKSLEEFFMIESIICIIWYISFGEPIKKTFTCTCT